LLHFKLDTPTTSTSDANADGAGNKPGHRSPISFWTGGLHFRIVFFLLYSRYAPLNEPERLSGMTKRRRLKFHPTLQAFRKTTQLRLQFSRWFAATGWVSRKINPSLRSIPPHSGPVSIFSTWI
jgi:hypothetical protein